MNVVHLKGLCVLHWMFVDFEKSFDEVSLLEEGRVIVVNYTGV